ncbi:MAG: zinc ribbon domain-containing protein [Caldilineaceae bacterium]|nr:zinc ribbon domain-containing protein [Caldilineaceae bacterium]
MSNVQRICPHCGESGDLQASHCPYCGEDLSGGVPMRQENALSATVTRAALPVLAGAAGLIVRAGWKVLQNRLTAAAAQQALDPTARSTDMARRTAQAPTPRAGGRSVRIRSAWSVGDGRGNWRHGSSEHIIEFDE